MLKFYNYDVVCQEIPDEVTLAVNITGCPNRCEGCHSPWLWEDGGEVLCDAVETGASSSRVPPCGVGTDDSKAEAADSKTGMDDGKTGMATADGTPDFSGLEKIVEKYAGCITCVCFMGGDNSPEEVELCAKRVRELWSGLRTAWYSGRDELPAGIEARNFDYIKLGPYIRERGGLRSPDTNQKLYRIEPDGTRRLIFVHDPHKSGRDCIKNE